MEGYKEYLIKRTIRAAEEVRRLEAEPKTNHARLWQAHEHVVAAAEDLGAVTAIEKERACLRP